MLDGVRKLYSLELELIYWNI